MEFKTLKILIKPVMGFIVLFFASFVAKGEVQLIDGFVRAMPASVPNTAAYLALKNTGADTKLIGIKTNIAKQGQLHTMVEENGLLKMRQVSSFELGKNKILKLSPSADHIMLLGLYSPLEIGKKVKLQLEFDNNQTLTVNLPVLKSSQIEMAHHHH